MDVNQIMPFAWRCAVRALPFIGISGHFDFWEAKERQNILYSIFSALDYSSNVYNFIREINSHIKNDVIYGNYETQISVFSRKSDMAANTASRAYEESVYAAVRAIAACASVGNGWGMRKLYAAFAADDSVRASKKVFLNLEKIIEQDILNINAKRSPEVLFEDYADIWANFEKALIKEGCSYWANWYESLFSNNFNFNQKEVLHRIENIPQEIRDKGAAAVGNYMQEWVRIGSKRLNESRIIILGEKGAGKTCVSRRLIDPTAEMTKPSESTAGVDTSLWKMNDVNIRIWDFAGHTVTHAVHQFFLSERCLYILVYDGRSEERNRLYYWLNHMKNYGGNSQAFILVNERDQHAAKIPINNLKEKYAIAGVYSFNVKDDKIKLEEFRKDVLVYIENNPSWKNQEIPISYYEVKDELERRFRDAENSLELITRDEFYKIAADFQVGEPNILLMNLNALGVSLWYPDLEDYNTLILNPEWISEGVYSIINWASNTERHDIKLADFLVVFKSDLERYPEDKHEFLFNLLKHYELAYETKQAKRLVIPHLLKEDQPETLPEFLLSESLMLRYEANNPLPPNTISRFIIRHNEQIKKNGKENLVWKYGVILEDGKGSLALVREMDRSIYVSVKGNEQSKYISDLRTTLNNIFESYKSQHPTLNYKVISEKLDPRQELWLPEQDIVALNHRNRPYYDPIHDKNIPMQQTVIQYNLINPTFHLREGNTLILGGEKHFDNSTTNYATFNFNNCSLSLQGDINELAKKLNKKGLAEDAEEFTELVEVLDEIGEGATKEEVIKKNIPKRLKRILKDLGDEDSTLAKTVKGMKRGVSIAQDIAEKYNDIAQWLGLPQVPKPFLKSK